MTRSSLDRERPDFGERTGEQKIEVFEGVEGTRKAIERIIEAGKDYQHFIGYPNTKWEKENTEWARKNIVPKKVAAGIRSTGIYYPTETIKNIWQSTSNNEFRDVSLLSENFQLPLIFYIYGHTVLFIEEVGNDFRSLEVTDPRIAGEMKEIFERFLTSADATKEKEGNGREIDLYLIRHGEAESQEKTAKLSSKGKLQAEVATLRILSDIWSQGGGLLKFQNSPTLRAQETCDIMRTTSQRIVESSEHSPIKLYDSRQSKFLEAAGVIGPLMKMGVPYEEAVEHWLTNPEVVEGKTPRIIYEHLREYLRRGQKLADLYPKREKTYYIGVTHEVPLAALLSQISGRTLDELGGSIQNCESTEIGLKGKSGESPTIRFRGKEMKIENFDSGQNQ